MARSGGGRLGNQPSIVEIGSGIRFVIDASTLEIILPPRGRSMKLFRTLLHPRSVWVSLSFPHALEYSKAKVKRESHHPFSISFVHYSVIENIISNHWYNQYIVPLYRHDNSGPLGTGKKRQSIRLILNSGTESFFSLYYQILLVDLTLRFSLGRKLLLRTACIYLDMFLGI